MKEMYEILVKLSDGEQRALNFTSPSMLGLSIKTRIREITGFPIDKQGLVTGRKQLEDSSLLYASEGAQRYPVLHLLLRLRGATTKAGQKETNNFDARRDMNGRRLFHGKDGVGN